MAAPKSSTTPTTPQTNGGTSSAKPGSATAASQAGAAAVNSHSTPTAPTATAADSILEPAGTWPPPIFIRPDASSDERYYMEHRWHAQWSWYDKRASDSKTWYQRLQIIVGVGSVTVPVLVGITSTNETARSALQLATVLISLVVAASAAIENVKKYGDNWRNFRAAAEELAREKAMYDVASGPYRKSKAPFLLFSERCEDIIAKQNGNWLQMTQEKEEKEDKAKDTVPDSGALSFGAMVTTTETSAVSPSDESTMTAAG